MILGTVIAFLPIFITTSRSVPIQVEDEFVNSHTIVNEGSTLVHKEPNIIGSAVAPIVGAIVGPLLVNIANGITNGITSTISHEYEPLHHGGYDANLLSGSFDAYLVNVPGETPSYILLTAVDKINEDNDKNDLIYYGGASHYNVRNKDEIIATHKENNDNSSNGRNWVPQILSLKR